MSFIRKIKKGGKVYLAEVENQWVNGKCVQKHVRYIGKEVDGETVLASSISDIEVEEVKIYGPLMVLNHCAVSIELSQCLVFHKVFDGNVHDSKTLQGLIFQLKLYNIKNRLFVYDRGISSSRNIRDIRDLQCDALCGLPVRSDLKKLLRDAIANDTFIQINNRVRLNKTIFYVVTYSHTIDGVEGTLAVCFNEQQRKYLRESRYDEIEYAQVLLAKGQRIKAGLEKFFDKQGQLQKAVLNEAEEFDGYSCIFSVWT